MAYANRPTDPVMERSAYAPTAVDYHDRVRWGPIIAGLVIALSTQLILSALGAAIGSSTIAGSGAPRTDAGDVGAAVGIWSIVSLFIALFVGGWITARMCGPMNRNTALLNGAILWGTTLAFGSWLVASGVTGTFGILAANAGEIAGQLQQPGATTQGTETAVTAEQARQIASNIATAGWSFTIGSLLGLVAAMIGASVGARHPRTNNV